MTPTALQIFATIFALFALSRVILRLKDHQLTIKEVLFWASVWLGIILVVWIPTTAGLISTTLGINTREPIDTLIYVAIVVMLYLIYRMHVKTERLGSEVTRLVRLIGLQHSEEPKRKK